MRKLNRLNNKTYKSKKPKKPLTAKEFFEMAFNHHTEWMIRVKKPAFPFYMQLYNKSRNQIDVVVVADSPYSPLDCAKPVIEKRDPDYFIVLSEAWMRSMKTKEDFNEIKKNYQYGDIKKSQDRVEVLTVYGKSKDGKEQFSKNLKIIRNNKNEIIKFDELIVNGFNVTNIHPETRKLP